MKLWYQSSAHYPNFGGFPDALRRSFERARDPDTHIHIQDLEQPYGIVDLQYRCVEFLDTREILRNALRAADQGYDAFLIGNTADPGLTEVRELLDIPVIGMGEMSMHIACMTGRSFGIITLNEKYIPRILHNVRSYALEGRLAAVESLPIDRVPSMGTAFVNEDDARNLEAAFLHAAERCVDKGAEVIFAAGGVVHIFCETRGITHVRGAIVINGTVLLLKMGELAVKMQALTGGFVSKRLTYSSPSRDVRQALQTAFEGMPPVTPASH